MTLMKLQVVLYSSIPDTDCSTGPDHVLQSMQLAQTQSLGALYSTAHQATPNSKISPIKFQLYSKVCKVEIYK